MTDEEIEELMNRPPLAGRINLRCGRCGDLRMPLITPEFPDHVVVFCFECRRRQEVPDRAVVYYWNTTDLREEVR